MNVASGGGAKKGTVCRYFVTTGSCFYGDSCQFLHTNNFLSTTVASEDLRLRDASSSMVRGPGAGSPVLDPLFQGYVPPSGLPSESKLQTYMNATSRSLSPSLEKPKMFIPSITDASRDMTHAMAALSLDTALKGTLHNPSEMMSIPGMVNHGRLTHSRSSPSFTEYSVRSTLPSSSPFGHFGGDSLSVVSSGLHTSSSPILSPENSPLIGRRSRSPVGVNYLGAQSATSTPSTQDQFASTGVVYTDALADPLAYFATDETGAGDAGHGYILPEFHSFPGNPAHIEHMKPKANAPSFFLPDELRMDILHRHSLTMATVNPQDYSGLPAEVDNYHNLCPLDPSSASTPSKSSTFGFVTSVYKAANIKTGVHYCLRRIHGVRLPSSKCMAIVDTWKKLQHSNIVHLREVFTTKAFSDNSLVFVYDYHPGADTLMNQYFNQPTLTPANGYSPVLYNNAENIIRTFSHTHNKASSNLRQHAGLLPESLIWAYIVQLSSALRTIHAAGLACRAFEPSKILLTGKSRLRLNCCGIFDVLNYESHQQLNSRALTAHFQQEDLLAFGKVVLALACNSLVAVQRENLQSSLELVARNYSVDLRNLIMYLLSNQTRPRNVNDIMPMIGARFYTQLDAAQMRSDVIENELTKEVENGRLFRLVVKLGIINERPEFNLDPTWSETGDRYLLKLFRDYLFHQVTEDGRPWIDMSHIVQCLNKLDAGVPEKICLTSRDEQNVLVVTYAELKQCFESAIGEVLTATTLTKQTRPS